MAAGKALKEELAALEASLEGAENLVQVGAALPGKDFRNRVEASHHPLQMRDLKPPSQHPVARHGGCPEAAV